VPRLVAVGDDVMPVLAHAQTARALAQIDDKAEHVHLQLEWQTLLQVTGRCPHQLTKPLTKSSVMVLYGSFLNYLDALYASVSQRYYRTYFQIGAKTQIQIVASGFCQCSCQGESYLKCDAVKMSFF